jgi:hypothetical protein
MSDVVRLAVTDCAECDPAGPTCVRCVTLLEQEETIAYLRAEVERSQWAHGATLQMREEYLFVVKMWQRATGYRTPEEYTAHAPRRGSRIATRSRR